MIEGGRRKCERGQKTGREKEKGQERTQETQEIKRIEKKRKERGRQGAKQRNGKK